MSLFVKLCGIKTPADLEAAIEAGADAVGFVLTPSPRQVSPAEAASLMRMVPEGMLGVAVFHDPTPELMRQTAIEVAPDLFQAETDVLAGLMARPANSRGASPFLDAPGCVLGLDDQTSAASSSIFARNADGSETRAPCSRDRPLAPDRALPVVVADSGLRAGLERALAVASREMVLVDSAAKGGTGRVSDWDRLAGLDNHDRVILAGGLDPGNVADAITRVRPLGVDVSSGVEVRPGVKGHGLMRAFVDAARATSMPEVAQ